MTEPDFIGYILNLSGLDERAEVETILATHPDAVAQVERLRAAISPLAVDREAPAPPAGLALRTVGRLAEVLVATEPGSLTGPGKQPPLATPASSQTPRGTFPTDRSDLRGVGGRFRFDLVVAAGIGLMAVGLVFSFVSRVRYQNEVLACQNNLRILGQGLTGYANTHANQFPKVGAQPYPTAGSFVAALADAGQCPPGFHAVCPAAALIPDDGYSRATGPVTYSYTLGHVAPSGGILGLSRSTDPSDDNDLIPISADYPAESSAPGSGPTSPHRWGHNVLFAGGNVRFATTATVGVNGDDIYRNKRGVVAAGLDRADAVLGIAGDQP